MRERKSHLKTGFVLTLLLAVCLCFLSAVPAEAATAKPTISATKLTITVGETKTLTVKNGKNVKWTTSNKAVATVSAGKVKAIKAGKAVITAKVGTVSLKCTVTVKPKPTISLKTASIVVGKTKKLTIKNGTNVKWSTSNKSVATVTNGTVKGIKAGTAVISAKTGKYTLKCTVTVKAITVSNLKIKTNRNVMDADGVLWWNLGNELPLYTEFSAKLGTKACSMETAKKNLAQKWASSDNGIAKVDENGNVSAFEPGEVTISVTMGNATAKLKVIVLDEQYSVLLDKHIGIAKWPKVKNAKNYRVDFCIEDGGTKTVFSEEVTVTSIKVRKHYCIYVTPIFADGSEGDVMVSEYNGEATIPDESDYLYGYEYDRGIDYQIISFPKWDFIKNIDESSIREEADGTVYFSAKGPDGQPVRFKGSRIEIGKDGILFREGGVMVSLDSIGRIYGYTMSGDPGPSQGDIIVQGGYDTEMNPHPDTEDHMIFDNGGVFRLLREMGTIRLHNFQPNFIRISTWTGGDMIVNGCTLYYEPDDSCTSFKEIFLDEEFYAAYMDGEHYSLEKEQYDPTKGVFTFYLLMTPELKHREMRTTYENMKKWDITSYSLFFDDPTLYQIGDLKDADGNILDKKTGRIHDGTTLTVTIGNQDYDVKLPVVKQYQGASTMHDLVPYAYPAATGELKPLVIPIAWQDEPQNATDEQLTLFKNELGRVEDASGTVTDYSDAVTGRYSLSRYFDIASYGKLKLTSYLTDWYPAPYNFSEYKYRAMDKAFIDEAISWLHSTYPDKNWSAFDRDGNGYFDAVIFLNAGDMSNENGFSIISFGGAIHYRQTYGSEFAGSTDKPGMNNIVNMNALHFKDNTLIHEFSHGFGLIDYYDVTYSGRDAVGGYDMQSSSKGDWNAYSKYSVGWIEPKVVSGLAPGESVELEIGTLADTGDAIAIPAAGSTLDSPFSEYMLVDLFAGTGVNQYDAQSWQDIGDATGVRMYHVDARMEYHDYINSDYPGMTPCPVGTIHFANDYKPSGKYNLELIQAGGENTFTNPEKPDRTAFQKQDLFMAGSSFTTQKYNAFFDEGLFDNGMDFGYTVDVVSITGSGTDARAVIRITRQ